MITVAISGVAKCRDCDFTGTGLAELEAVSGRNMAVPVGFLTSDSELPSVLREHHLEGRKADNFRTQHNEFDMLVEDNYLGRVTVTSATAIFHLRVENKVLLDELIGEISLPEEYQSPFWQTDRELVGFRASLNRFLKEGK